MRTLALNGLNTPDQSFIAVSLPDAFRWTLMVQNVCHTPPADGRALSLSPRRNATWRQSNTDTCTRLPASKPRMEPMADHLWALVLAGGDGTRLQPLTR